MDNGSGWLHPLTLRCPETKDRKLPKSSSGKIRRSTWLDKQVQRRKNIDFLHRTGAPKAIFLHEKQSTLDSFLEAGMPAAKRLRSEAPPRNDQSSIGEHGSIHRAEANSAASAVRYDAGVASMAFALQAEDENGTSGFPKDIGPTGFHPQGWSTQKPDIRTERDAQSNGDFRGRVVERGTSRDALVNYIACARHDEAAGTFLRNTLKAEVKDENLDLLEDIDAAAFHPLVWSTQIPDPATQVLRVMPQLNLARDAKAPENVTSSVVDRKFVKSVDDRYSDGTKENKVNVESNSMVLLNISPPPALAMNIGECGGPSVSAYVSDEGSPREVKLRRPRDFLKMIESERTEELLPPLTFPSVSEPHLDSVLVEVCESSEDAFPPLTFPPVSEPSPVMVSKLGRCEEEMLGSGTTDDWLPPLTFPPVSEPSCVGVSGGENGVGGREREETSDDDTFPPLTLPPISEPLD